MQTFILGRLNNVGHGKSPHFNPSSYLIYHVELTMACATMAGRDAKRMKGNKKQDVSIDARKCLIDLP